MKKAKSLTHRNRGKTNRYRAKQKAKLQRRRKKQSSGVRKTYR